MLYLHYIYHFLSKPDVRMYAQSGYNVLYLMYLLFLYLKNIFINLIAKRVILFP